MKVANVMGIILVCLGIYLGYVGVNKLANNTNEVKILGLKIDASNENGQTKGVIMLVVAAALIGGGAMAMKRK